MFVHPCTGVRGDRTGACYFILFKITLLGGLSNKCTKPDIDPKFEMILIKMAERSPEKASRWPTTSQSVINMRHTRRREQRTLVWKNSQLFPQSSLYLLSSYLLYFI